MEEINVKTLAELENYINEYIEDYPSYIRKNSRNKTEYKNLLKYNEYVTGVKYFESFDLNEYKNIECDCGYKLSSNEIKETCNSVYNYKIENLENDPIAKYLSVKIRQSAKCKTLSDLMNEFEARLNEKSRTKICTRAQMDRRTYSHMINTKDITPEKDNLISLCFGYKLNIDDSFTLLKTCGYTFTSGKRDAAIIGLIKNQVYDVIECNKYLKHFNLKLINEKKLS